MTTSQIIAATPFALALYKNSDTNEVKDQVKSGSTTIHAVVIDNSANGAVTFVKFWNLTSGSVTVGTTDPDMIIRIPASTKRTMLFHEGLVFATGLTVAAVTAGGTGGTTGPTSDVSVEIAYV